MQRPEILLIYINIFSPFPNLGIASLSAYLKERGISVRQANLTMPSINGVEELPRLQKASWVFYQEMTAFLNNEKTALPLSNTHQQFKKVLMLWTKYLLQDEPKSLGLSLHSDNVIHALLLAQMVKNERPDIPIIVGGPECNEISSAMFLKTGYVDKVVEGEGEETLYEILCRFKERKPVSIPCKIIPAGTDIQRFPAAAPLAIDDLPTPDYDGVLKTESPIVALPVAFNRGCSFRCSFCNERKFWITFRQVKVEKAIAILNQLEEKYGVKRYLLCQSLANNDIKWLKDLSTQIHQAGINVLWGGNARIHGKMDEDYFRTLYLGGCRFFFWGIESASMPVLKSMQKGTTPKINKKVLQAAASSGLWNHTYWIFGFPTETEADLLLSVDFILENAEFIHSAVFHLYLEEWEGESGGIPPQNLMEYYRLLRTKRLALKSPLVEKYSKFFNRITFIMNNKLLKGTEKFEEGFLNAAVLEEKRRMLVLLHLLRYFIVEPEIREELAGIFTKEIFMDVYDDFCRLDNPPLKYLAEPNREYGKLLFSRMIKIEPDRTKCS